MAKNQTQPSPAPTAPSNVANLPTAAKPPEGMSRVGTDVEAFWNPEKGPIYGRLVGAKDYTKDGKIQRIYAIELKEKCPVKTKLTNGDIAEDTSDPGELVGVWGSAGLNDLNMLGGATVWINRGAKKALSGNRTMWTFDVRASGPGRPLRVQQTNQIASASDASGDDDSIPF